MFYQSMNVIDIFDFRFIGGVHLVGGIYEYSNFKIFNWEGERIFLNLRYRSNCFDFKLSEGAIYTDIYDEVNNKYRYVDTFVYFVDFPTSCHECFDYRAYYLNEDLDINSLEYPCAEICKLSENESFVTALSNFLVDCDFE